ncbi:DNA polymerase IV [Candidatus Falkowbacteria bacterium]|nr:DNA polymerase IV [Candidatus Falkowbacteria bacterium]
MKHRIIVHLDMNSYFASVEQQANPFLRGRSVAVCAYLSENGTIIASSVEAKAKGIKTGTRVSDALRLDPELVLVENEPAKYRTVTERIFNILRSYTDAMEPYSIDEAFMDLTGWVKDFAEAEQVAQKIKQRITIEVGDWLRCSVGISWTKFLAKFAGDIAPKGGVLVITSENLESFLLCDVQTAWGIGKAMAARLRSYGIVTLLDLKNSDPILLRLRLGSCGYYLWCHVNGREISGVAQEASLPKSIGHSYCLPRKTSDKEYLAKALLKLCEKTGRRLRALGLEAKTGHLYASCLHDSYHQKTFRSQEGIFTTNDLFMPLHAFLLQTNLPLPVFKLAVTVTGLAPVSNQLELFSDRSKHKDISLAMDRINDRYGEYTVKSGLMLGSDDMAKDRVGFRKVAGL